MVSSSMYDRIDTPASLPAELELPEYGRTSHSGEGTSSSHATIALNEDLGDASVQGEQEEGADASRMEEVGYRKADAVAQNKGAGCNSPRKHESTLESTDPYRKIFSGLYDSTDESSDSRTNVEFLKGLPIQHSRSIFIGDKPISSSKSPRQDILELLDGLIVCIENSKPESGKAPPVGNGFTLAKMRKLSLD